MSRINPRVATRNNSIPISMLACRRHLLSPLAKRYFSNSPQNSSASENSISNVLSRVTSKLLSIRSVESARSEASLLVGLAINKPRDYVLLHPNVIITKDMLAKINELVEKRAKEEPIAYIQGFKEFWSMEFKVTAHTLIPRPATETLVQETLNCIKTYRRDSDNNVSTFLELGTGTGCISISILKELQKILDTAKSKTDHPVRSWKGFAVDIQTECIKVAQENAASLGVSQDEIQFLHSNWTSVFDTWEEKPTFEVVVSNPPYLTTYDWENLPPTIKSYEPPIAFQAGNDGLDCYREISTCIIPYIRSKSILTLEIGAWQESEVVQLFTLAGFKHLHSVKDLDGFIRVVVLQYM